MTTIARLNRSLASAMTFAALPFFSSIGQSPQAPDPILQRIWAVGMDSSRTFDLAQVLLDSIGPRLTGTSGLERAQDWLVRTYASWGIPAENERWGTWRGWRRGTLHVDLLEPRVRTLDAALLGLSPGTGDRNVVGPTIVLPLVKHSQEFAEWLPQAKGKFVLISASYPSCRPEEDWARGAAPASRARMDSTVARLSTEWSRRLVATGVPAMVPLASRLEEAGALGVIYSQPEGIFSGAGSGLWGTYNVFDVYLPRAHRGVAIAMGCEDYGLLFRLTERRQGAVLRVKSDAAVLADVPVANTIARIAGTERPNEYVMLSAHFDSYDAASGAKDNGAGSVVMMEAMRILKSAYPRPKRTIIAGHWTAEEAGLVGSTAWAADHPEVVRNLAAYFEQDNGTWRSDSITGGGLIDGGARVESWVGKLPPAIRATLHYGGVGEPYGFGSDGASFSCYGAPVFVFHPAWQDELSHTNLDTFDKLAFDDLRERATTVAMLAYLASEDATLVSRARARMVAGHSAPDTGRVALRARMAAPSGGGAAAVPQWPPCRLPERGFRVPYDRARHPAPVSGAATAFVVRRGQDTVSIERFTRTATTLRTDAGPKGLPPLSMVAQLRPDGSISRIEAYSPALPIERFLDFKEMVPDPVDTATTPVSAPFVLSAISLTEQIIKGLKLAVGDSAQLRVARLGPWDVVPMTVTRMHMDSVTVRVPQISFRFSISSTGDILSGVMSERGWTVERVTP